MKKLNIFKTFYFPKRIIIFIGIIIVILGIFSYLNSKNTKNTTISNKDLKQLSQEDAKDLIKNTSLKERQNISKQLWLKSEILNELSYNVLWGGKTERAFTSELNKEKREGIYVTKGCGIEVFSSEDKFEGGTGWPSFTKSINQSNVVLKEDRSFGMKRVEVLSKCGEHLGHVFNDGPIEEGGERWCINGAALEFIPKEELEGWRNSNIN